MLTQQIVKEQIGALQASMKPEAMAGFYAHAERWFRDEVGTALWTFLGTLTPTDPTYKELLRLAQSCLAWQAYSLAFPHQKFRVGELGMMKSSPSSTIAVTKWEYIDTKDANLAMLDLSLEYFWRELESLRPAAWTNSTAYAERNNHFLRSAAELAQVLPIAGRNYRFFQKLVPHIETVEDDHIQPTLTTGVYLDLKAKWRNPLAQFSFEEEKLLILIRRAVAYLAIYEAFPYLPLTLDEIGVAETRSKDGVNEGNRPDKGLRQDMRQQLYTDGQKRLSKVIDFLDAQASATHFASYYQANRAIEATADDFTDKPHIIL